MTRRARITPKEWRAIGEALRARLAGEIDIEGEPDMPERDDYESALRKVEQKE